MTNSKGYSKLVPMNAFGKARPRVTKNGTFMPKDYIAKRDELRSHCNDMPDFSAQAVMLTVTVSRPMPKSWSQKKKDQMRGFPTTAKPDIDNIVGAVMDALLPEDSNVARLYASKNWGDEPAIAIQIESIGDGIPF